MSHVNRSYNIENLIEPGKVLIIYGPRRVGKSTLVLDYLKGKEAQTLSENGENLSVQKALSSQNFELILDRVANKKIYFIDEAQNVPNIGLGLKIMVDNRPDLIVIATGSSSFDLANKLGEPLVGRRRLLNLFPFALQELKKQNTATYLKDNLHNHLLYGFYPQVYNASNTFLKREILTEISDGYLLKDLLSLEQIREQGKLVYLLQLLAQYIGQPISSHKLANELDLNRKTVERYLYLLEKTFVIKKVLPFSHKLSQSLKFKPKYYFYDLGIRNVLIGNFQPIETRKDIGQLWENFCFMERLKKTTYDREFIPNYYFFQEYSSSKEIDIVEEYNGYKAFECKWQCDKVKIALDEWDKNYPDSSILIIHKDNYLDFLS